MVRGKAVRLERIKIKPNRIINGHIGGRRKVEFIDIAEEMQPINGRKVADAFRSLQSGFMKARGISKDDIRIKGILEVRKNEK